MRFDLSGKTFGRLRVESVAGKTGSNNTIWRCVCQCGKVRNVIGSCLTSGHTASCGCISTDRIREIGYQQRRHGYSRPNGSHSPTYTSWEAMRSRCSDPAAIGYRNYGGRGITVCDKWNRSFDAFLADMGERPSRQTTLDRIDVNGNYEPGNCRWASKSQQCRNTRYNLVLEFNGKSLCVADWADELKMSRNAIYLRIKQGWSVERTLTTPVKSRKPRSRKKQAVTP